MAKEAKELKVKNWNVTRAHKFQDGNISFDAEINGISLYGMTLVWYKKEKRYFIGFPSRKSGDSYFNHYWFRASDDFVEQIVDAVEALLEDE